TGTEFTLSGNGAGTTEPEASQKPTPLGNGTYRYYFKGAFGVGLVRLTFAEGSWADVEGNPSAASTSFFHVINQLKEDPAQSEGRVFFIEISGGLELNGAGFLD